MQTVSSQLGQPQLEVFPPHSELVSADAVGIELELEGFSGDSLDQTQRLVRPLWTIIGDGSLRNGGVEFITQGGFGGAKLIQAINKLQTTLESVNYDASWRCSTHMHINMLDFTVNQVARFIMVYAACEPILFDFCGAYRKSSNFCTPLGDSLPFHRKIMSRMYDDAISRRSPQQLANKYVALNVLPLFPDQRTGRALGTVEFRGGRPLVSRSEMILQANLLLSIKQYVREFQGDEEAMLNELSQGVHNTVYANGVAAGIQPNGDTLELALVNAWALLKSYQQGRAQAQEEAQQFSAPPQIHDVPQGAWDVTYGSGRRGRGRSVILGSHVADTMGAITDLGRLSLYVSDETWPSLHQHFNTIADRRNPTLMLSTAFAVAGLQSTRRHGLLSDRNITVALMNWAGGLTGGSTEQTPVNTLVRLRRNTNASGGEHQEPAHTVPGLGGAMAIDSNSFSGKCLYEQSLPSSLWVELCEKLGYTGGCTNRDVWNWLLEHRVRFKGRQALASAMSDAGVHIDTYTGWNLNESSISTVTLIRLLKLCRLKSVGHVWSSDRREYDKMVYILHVLEAHGLHVPYLKPGTGGLRWCNPRGMGRNVGQGFNRESVDYEYSAVDMVGTRTATGVFGTVTVY